MFLWSCLVSGRHFEVTLAIKFTSRSPQDKTTSRTTLIDIRNAVTPLAFQRNVFWLTSLSILGKACVRKLSLQQFFVSRRNLLLHLLQSRQKRSSRHRAKSATLQPATSWRTPKSRLCGRQTPHPTRTRERVNIDPLPASKKTRTTEYWLLASSMRITTAVRFASRVTLNSLVNWEHTQ